MDSRLFYNLEKELTRHLVRMEMTVKTIKNGTNGSFRNTLDNSIITDIDDMMEGNLVI